jgi:hypothetical protein
MREFLETPHQRWVRQFASVGFAVSHQYSSLRYQMTFVSSLSWVICVDKDPTHVPLTFWYWPTTLSVCGLSWFRKWNLEFHNNEFLHYMNKYQLLKENSTWWGHSSCLKSLYIKIEVHEIYQKRYIFRCSRCLTEYKENNNVCLCSVISAIDFVTLRNTYRTMNNGFV